MANTQERLQMGRGFLDKWSIREQLCLASAVACSGDQNWMSVSRTLKIVCGSSKECFNSRPADWFSQKNCAVQYGHVLDEVETQRQKKRASDSNVSTSPSTAKPPVEIVLRNLTEDRMKEIKFELRKQQEEYAKLYNEIKSIQNDEVEGEQLLQMWNELEKEQEKQRIEEMKFENQLRERELKKQELQRSWRAGSVTNSASPSSNTQKSSTNTTAVDMDVEEIIGTGKTNIPSYPTNSGQIQTGTSPLLSSLLKSPTATVPASNLVSSPSVRNTAPTITTLLTGGSIPNQNQPAIIPSHNEAVQLLTRPLTGPPLDTIVNPTVNAQNLLSPSQSAPTLSMLLEKNKTIGANTTEVKTVDLIPINTKIPEHKTVEDSNNESIPMDIEENLTATKTESTLQSDEIDETDPNEEQQLLEVFRNIGNIEELDIDVSDVIDEEVDFLKGVDEETPLDENIDIGQKVDVNCTELEGNLISESPGTGNLNKAVESEKEMSTEKGSNENISENEVNKIEIISSDDSNDNIPLAAVASLESSKDRLNTNESSSEETFLKDQVESANIKNDLDQVETANDNPENSADVKREQLEENEKFNQERSKVDDKNKSQFDNSINKDEDDIFIAPIAEETKQEKSLKLEKEEVFDRSVIKVETKYENETNESFIFTAAENNEQPTSSTASLESQTEIINSLATSKLQPPPLIPIADTDENSSSTDISIQTRKDEKLGGRAQRKSPHETKTDDELQNPIKQQMVIPSISSSCGNLTPRPTALRKLRDRDRSESPMIDDDATTHSDHSMTNQRSRRRYSSTPVIDSVPNSPASSDRDERDLRTSKKSLLSVYNVLLCSKYSPTIQRILNEETAAQKLNEICLRPIDFSAIKKNIDSGLIRTFYELQRDILWMCQNALTITKSSSASFKTILQFQQECQHIREFMPSGCEISHRLERDTRDNKSNSSNSSSLGASISKGRSGSRKSLRLS